MIMDKRLRRSITANSMRMIDDRITGMYKVEDTQIIFTG